MIHLQAARRGVSPGVDSMPLMIGQAFLLFPTEGHISLTFGFCCGTSGVRAGPGSLLVEAHVTQVPPEGFVTCGKEQLRGQWGRVLEGIPRGL